MFKRIALPTIVLALALLAVSAWQATSTRAQSEPMMGPPLNQLSGDDFDKAFLAQMSMHHAMAIPMSRPVVANAAHQEVKDLGQGIITAQTAEIQKMSDWAKAWYGMELSPMVGMMAQANTDPMATGGPVDMAGRQSGMMNGPGGMMGGQTGGPGGADISQMSMMADLWKLTPPRLEVVFMSLMIPHHQSALDMAQLVPDRAAHQELKDLAQQIVSSQSAEISQMKAWLATWYGL